MGRLFGTDGVRGVANIELTCELALKIGRAAAAVLSGNGQKKPTVLVGMDTRLSSDMLAAALSAGLCSAGADVINLGVLPTPAVAHLTVKYKASAGIMISASHNPYEYNGIKIFNSEGYKLADALEERIESIVLDGIPEAPLAGGGSIGRITCGDNAASDYIDYLCGTVAGPLEGLRIAVDCANGSASRTAGELFTRLGADFTLLSSSPNGTNINDNCGSTHLDALKEYVLENSLDAGVAFDGDADRCLFIDENGNEIDGDMTMAILALGMKARGGLKKDTVVGTVMTNFGFTKFCGERGLHFISTKVGDRYVLEEMLAGDYSLGGEQSGHIIFREHSTTGDGQLTAIQLLSHLNRTGKKLSEAAGIMTRYPQFTVNVKTTPEGKLAFYTDGEIKSLIEGAKKELGESGRIVTRPSGTEPLIRIMTEGEDSGTAKRIAEDVAKKIETQLLKYIKN